MKIINSVLTQPARRPGSLPKSAVWDGMRETLGFARKREQRRRQRDIAKASRKKNR